MPEPHAHRVSAPQPGRRPRAAGQHKLQFPAAPTGWRATLLGLGRRRAVALFTVVSILVSLVVTALTSELVAGEVKGVDLLTAVLVPLLVTPLISNVGMSLLYEVEAAREHAHQMAVRDGLTNLYNRRFFMAQLASEATRALREQRPLSVVLIDVDHFKSINDTYGHATGDEVLELMAGLLLDAMRPYDVVARFGGEEFVALLPGSGLDAALTVAERLRDQVASLEVHGMPDRPAPQVTVSLGVSCLAPEDEGVAPMLARADQAMYEAKRGGRNRCVVLAPPGTAGGLQRAGAVT
jgi:diguanylate cyclase (GGDEF)-like protein